MTDNVTSSAPAEVAPADEARPIRYEIPDDDALSPPVQSFEDAAEDEAPETEPEADDPIDDDLVEIEYEGKKAKVPSELKDAFLRHADYTRKTQEVAEARRLIEGRFGELQTFEKSLAETVELQRAQIDRVAAVKQIDAQLAQFPQDQTGWAQWEQQDPVKAASLFRQFQQLRDARGQLVEQVSQAERQMQENALQRNQEMQRAAQEAQVRAAQDCIKALSKEIKGFNREVVQKIEEHAMTGLGFKPEEIRNVTDPWIWKLVHENMTLKAAAKAKVDAVTAKPETPTRPIASVAKGSGARGSDDPDRKDISAWMRDRRQQVNRFGGMNR